MYVLFLISEKRVWVTTSATMAQQYATEPTIKDRYVRSKAAVRTFDSQLRQIWDGTPVATAARPTYRVGPDYAHKRPETGVLVDMFRKAGLMD